MLEITIDNCYKCDLEIIIDPNNSQYFWTNRRDLEIETKRNWQVIFDKYKDLSTQKYRRELTPNLTFQPKKIFVRNDLFEKVIKSCKATNLDFLKLKEKLGLCLYEDICDEKKFILMSQECFIQHDVENKQLKEENKKLNENENDNDNENENENDNDNDSENENGNENENENENEKFGKNKIVKDANIQELIEEPKEIKIPSWIDKSRFKKSLIIIDSNKFGYKSKIGELKYIDIKDLFNNITNNTISEIDAKKRLNTLNKIKNSEIKHRRIISGQKELLNCQI